MDDSLDLVILAAGKGTRMRSRRPKVLHLLGGIPLLEHVLRTAFSLSPRRVVVVVGHGGEEVRATFADCGVTFVDQGEPRGTGQAVLVAREAVASGAFLVLPGDVPLIPPHALRSLVQFHRERNATVSFLTMEPPDPGPYGRVVRGEDGRPLRIVEASDATTEERAIREVNSGIWCLNNSPELWDALAGLTPANAKGEFYLTDLVAHFSGAGRAGALLWPDPEDLRGVNDRLDLAQVEHLLRQRILTAWMRDGVTVVDPAAVYPSLDAAVGEDTILHPGTHLVGRTVIGEGCTVGPHAYLVDARIEGGARVWYSVVEGAVVGAEAQIGPYAHLRPGARIGRRAKVGNFVEVKEATLGEGVKAGHLAYIGDAEVGAGANIGAGAITCNFQPGKKGKFRTEIGRGAFIGSNASLVAPIRIGEGAVVKTLSVSGGASDILALALSPDEKMVAVGGVEEKSKLGLLLWYDLGSGRLLRSKILSVAWEVRTPGGTIERTLIFWVRSIEFSPDGTILAAGSEDRVLRVWDKTGETVLATLAGHPGAVYGLAFSPDGKRLAAASWREVVVWDVPTWKVVATLSGHRNQVWAVAYSPDGKLLASGAYDGYVRLWDAESFALLSSERLLTPASGIGAPLEQGVLSLAFSPDGRFLAAVGSGGRVVVWQVAGD